MVDQSAWAIRQPKWYLWELPETRLSADCRRLASIAKYYFYGVQGMNFRQPIVVIEKSAYATPNEIGQQILLLASNRTSLTFDEFTSQRNSILENPMLAGIRDFYQLEVCLKGWKILMLDEMMASVRKYPDEHIDETVAAFAQIWLGEFFGERVFRPTRRISLATDHILGRIDERSSFQASAPTPVEFAWRLRLFGEELVELSRQFDRCLLDELGAAEKGTVGKDLLCDVGSVPNWELCVISYWKHHVENKTYSSLSEEVWNLGPRTAKDRAFTVSAFLRKQVEKLITSGFTESSTYFDPDFIPLALLHPKT